MENLATVFAVSEYIIASTLEGDKQLIYKSVLFTPE
jgi:hypothetical protein